MRLSFTLVALFAAALFARGQQPEKDDIKAVKAKLKGYWQERSADPKAAKYDITWEIFTHAPDRARLTDQDNESQQRDHQVHLNISADPMWFDVRFQDGGRERVAVGIFKIVGDEVHRSSGKWIDAAVYDKANGRVLGRPIDFSPKAGHSVVFERMKGAQAFEAKKMSEPYDGFKADQALLRKQLIYKARDGGKDTKASSGEACLAAQRIFSRVSFLFRTRDEVLDMLGDPATINDYNQPAGKEPGSPLVYRFDSGLGGLKYTISFGPLDKTRVSRVEVEGQN